MTPMSGAVPFTTDYSTLAIFDSEVLEHRKREPGSWWRQDDLRDVGEVMEGKIALLPIGKEGSYRVEVRVGEASEAELEMAAGSVGGLGLSISSGELFAGAPERIPGDGRGGPLRHIPGTGALLEIEPGDYGVEVYVLNWRGEDAWFDEDGEVVPTAPADFLVLLAPRDPEAALALSEPLTPLLELLPKHEAKAKAKVIAAPKRRRSSASSERGRRRRGSSDPLEGPVEAKPPAHVPEEVAPLTPQRVAAAFREVLYGDLLHPAPGPEVQTILLRPHDRTLLAHDLDGPTLLKKITRVREQLRMLEAKVNGNKALDNYQRVELQTPVTRVYESLDVLLSFLSSTLKQES